MDSPSLKCSAFSTFPSEIRRRDHKTQDFEYSRIFQFHDHPLFNSISRNCNSSHLTTPSSRTKTSMRECNACKNDGHFAKTEIRGDHKPLTIFFDEYPKQPTPGPSVFGSRRKDHTQPNLFFSGCCKEPICKCEQPAETKPTQDGKGKSTINVQAKESKASNSMAKKQSEHQQIPDSKSKSVVPIKKENNTKSTVSVKEETKPSKTKPPSANSVKEKSTKSIASMNKQDGDEPEDQPPDLSACVAGVSTSCDNLLEEYTGKKMEHGLLLKRTKEIDSIMQKFLFNTPQDILHKYGKTMTYVDVISKYRVPKSNKSLPFYSKEFCLDIIRKYGVPDIRYAKTGPAKTKHPIKGCVQDRSTKSSPTKAVNKISTPKKSDARNEEVQGRAVKFTSIKKRETKNVPVSGIAKPFSPKANTGVLPPNTFNQKNKANLLTVTPKKPGANCFTVKNDCTMRCLKNSDKLREFLPTKCTSLKTKKVSDGKKKVVKTASVETVCTSSTEKSKTIKNSLWSSVGKPKSKNDGNKGNKNKIAEPVLVTSTCDTVKLEQINNIKSHTVNTPTKKAVVKEKCSFSPQTSKRSRRAAHSPDEFLNICNNNLIWADRKWHVHYSPFAGACDFSRLPRNRIKDIALLFSPLLLQPKQPHPWKPQRH